MKEILTNRKGDKTATCTLSDNNEIELEVNSKRQYHTTLGENEKVPISQWKEKDKLLDTAKAILLGNYDNENPHIKSRENEARNLKTHLKVSENSKLNPKLVDGKNT